MTVINKSRWIPDAPVAQLDRALPSEGRGQRFESSRVRHFLNIFQYFATILIIKK